MFHIKCEISKGRGLAKSIRAKDIQIINNLSEKTYIDGSLNLISRKPIFLLEDSAIFCHNNHFFWQANLSGIEVLVNRWKGCPAHVFEIFAEEHIKSKLLINNGDTVNLYIPESSIDLNKGRSIKSQLSWNALWRWRESLFYNDTYTSFLRKTGLIRYAWHSAQ